MLGNVPYNKKYIGYVPDPYHHPNQSDTRNVPFFIESNINEELYNRLNLVSDSSMSVLKNGSGLHYFPDGAIKFYKLNNESMKADVKVDDCRDL